MDNSLMPSEVTIGHFNLQKIIGKDGFGQVWKALDPYTNVYNKKHYAIKIMS
jgi:serine/threonine protein kinase